MKLNFLTLVATFIASVNALAMPAFDGVYTCTVPGAPAQTVTLETRDNKLYVKGGGNNGNDGIPCENASGNQTAGGYTVTVTTTCDVKTLSALVAAVQPTTDTDFSVLTRFTLVNEKTVGMYVKSKGKINGNAVDTEADITCVK